MDDINDWLDDFDTLPADFIESLWQLLEFAEEQKHAAQEAELEKAAGLAESVDADFLKAVFDQRDLLDRAKCKWYTPSKTIGDRRGSSRLTKKKGICVHHSAVFRGFGADKGLIKHYMKQPLVLTRFIETSRELTHEEWARAMALGRRFRGDPPRKFNMGVAYQAISAANSVLVLNLPFDWVTWASNGANNSTIAYCWDADSRRETGDWEDLKADIRYIVNLARSEGHPLEFFTVHSAWTAKPHDPGRDFILKVLKPLCPELSMYIDYDFSAARGTPMRKTIEKLAR